MDLFVCAMAFLTGVVCGYASKELLMERQEKRIEKE
jgi:hypothetical protein